MHDVSNSTPYQFSNKEYLRMGSRASSFLSYRIESDHLIETK